MTSPSLAALANLARIGKLKAEPHDARQITLSLESHFDLAYNAAHAATRSALRVHGYRSDNRYLVLQCLEHTLGFTPAQWLLLNQAHTKHNLAEYERDLDVTVSCFPESIDRLIKFAGAV